MAAVSLFEQKVSTLCKELDILHDNLILAQCNLEKLKEESVPFEIEKFRESDNNILFYTDMLMKTLVTKEDVHESTEKITKFVVMTQCLYVCTRWCTCQKVYCFMDHCGHSLASSLSHMGHLLKLVTSANGIAFQTLSRIFLRNNFRQLLSMASGEVRKHCSQKTMKRNTTPELLGRPKQAPQDVTHLLQENLGIVDSVEEYNRMQVCGCVIHSEQYISPLKRDSTAVKVGNDYAKVERVELVGSRLLSLTYTQGPKIEN